MTKSTVFIKLFNEQTLADRYETLSRDVIKQSQVLFKKLSDVRIRAKLTRERLAEIEAYLRRKFPSFNDVTDTIFQELVISSHSPSKGVYFSPLLLLGPPGVGKTFYAQELSELLGLGFEKIDLSTTTGVMVVTGSTSQWSGSKPGLVASHLLQNPLANFVLFLDEIDKAGQKSSNGGNINNSLLTLLEPETARTFQDEYVQVPIDASHICIIATANNINNIEDPILSRMKTVNVAEPTLKQLRQIAPYALENILKNFEVEGLLSSNLDKAALDALQINKISVRQLNQVLRKALELCIRDKAEQVSEIHITKAIEIFNGVTKKPEQKPSKKLH